MNFERLKHRVERTEQLVDGRIAQTRDEYISLRGQWREAWTPGRIVIAGLVSGFAAGRAAPQRAVRNLGRLGKQLGDPRWLKLISSLAGLATSIQATVAAARAKDAAQTADDAADSAEEANEDVTARTAAVAASVAPGARPAPGTAPGPAPAATAAPAPAAGDVRAAAGAGAAAAPSAAAPSAAQDRRRPDQSWERQPAPAEAATDVSER